MDERQSLIKTVSSGSTSDDDRTRHNSLSNMWSNWRQLFAFKGQNEKYEKLNDDRDQARTEQTVGYFQLFRFADRLDIVLISFGFLLAVANGLVYTGRFVVFGELISEFAAQKFHGQCPVNKNVSNPANNTKHCPLNNTHNILNHNQSQNSCLLETTTPVFHPIFSPEFRHSVQNHLYQLLIIAVLELLCIGIRYFLLTWSAGRQVARIRIRLLKSLLRRNMRYCDTNSMSQFSVKLFNNIDNLGKGIGFEASMLPVTISATVFSSIYSLVIDWKLALSILSTVPLTLIGCYGFSKLTTRETKHELEMYSQAGEIVQEVFGSLRTVLSLNGEKFEVRRYSSKLKLTRWSTIRKGAAFGLLAGWVYLIGYMIYSVGFGVGSIFMNKGQADPKLFHDVIVIVILLVRPITNVAFVSPFFQYLEEARGAITPIFRIIDEENDITLNEKDDPLTSNISTDPLSMNGDIKFENISFSYPTRPDAMVLQNLSLIAREGETTALVGSSGCGKSTCISLLLRFYDPLSGRITVGDHSIDSFNLKQLRHKIGIVGQEPILFATSIYENIRMGNVHATRSEIEDAARQANAHDFIMRLPDKYYTVVGERGVQLSGGEKQRVALARALVKKPTIVLLDEATSALDNKNEKIVQEALDRACKGRTTIVIAHRLAAVKNAHRIYVFDKGHVIEQGTHDSLISDETSHYHELMNIQREKIVEYEVDDTPDIVEKDSHQLELLDRPRIVSHYEVEDKDTKKKFDQPVFFRLLSMNKPEWILILVGCITCLLGGLCLFLQAAILTIALNSFGECTFKARHHVIVKCAIFLILVGIGNLILRFIQYTAFSASGSRLTERICVKSFSHLLRQEMAFFDRSENTSGAICNRLSSDALAVQSMAGSRLGVICESLATFGVAIMVGFFFSWQLTLVLVGFVLLFFAIALLHINWQSRMSKRFERMLGLASSLAVEIIHNMRTVKQLANEMQLLRRFSELVVKEFKSRRIEILISSFIHSIYWGTAPLILLALCWVALTLIVHAEMAKHELSLVFAYSIFGLESLRCIMTLTRSMSESLTAARNFFDLLDRIPAIDNDSNYGSELPDLKGEIQFDQVKFAYPSRPKICILNKFELSVKPGQRVALVGSSGSGKSTVIQLLERFYEPIKGRIYLDGVDIRELNIKWLRSCFGLVSQEPVLFNMTIAENIAYGKENVLMKDVIEAATKANIHTFIQQLPQSYETKVGMKGSHLSGGEKQRIAIARILLRQPKILLLDEATSAMDTHNEQIVQEALDKAQLESPNRTSLTIAHRLSTIRSCDQICVVDHGFVIESGAHADLMERRGAYYKMILNSSNL